MRGLWWGACGGLCPTAPDAADGGHLLILRGSKPKDDQEFFICSTTLVFRFGRQSKAPIGSSRIPRLAMEWTWTASNSYYCPSSFSCRSGCGELLVCLFARSLAESRAASIPKSPTAHLKYHYRPTNAAWFPPSISFFEAEDGEWSLPLIGIRFVDFSRADGPQVSQASRDILVPPSHTVSLKPSLTTLRPSEPLLFSSNSRWLQYFNYLE